MKFQVFIPARYASTRLPGKMLADIHGKPLIQHTYERAVASGAARVVIATDNPEIQAICVKFGAEVCMTAEAHTTGTDRIAEAARILGLAEDDLIVNLQGDEPGMPPEFLQQLARALAEKPRLEMATVCVPINSLEEIFDPNIVKAVLDQAGNALYFSRAPVPWDRNSFGVEPKIASNTSPYYRHLGLYAFRNQFLQQFVGWQPAPIEKIELLEQLRALYYGARIHVTVFNRQPPVGVDTLEDLQQVKKALKQND